MHAVYDNEGLRHKGVLNYVGYVGCVLDEVGSCRVHPSGIQGMNEKVKEPVSQFLVRGFLLVVSEC
jgi:hypothetical protein